MKWSLIVLLIGISLCESVVLNAAEIPKREMRAVWLTTNYALDWPKSKANTAAGRLKQQREMIRILDQLAAANFNVVLFQTRLRGDVLYPSYIEPWSSVLTGSISSPGYDPLDFMIKECHKRGMECHAWIVSIPLGTTSHVRALGKRSIANSRPDMCKQLFGEYYLDPGHPETALYILSLVKEVVLNYDIDGIHLDYIRYPDKADNFPDKNTYIRSGSRLPLKEWRRENINRIVYGIYDWVKKTKPRVKVSSATLGRYISLNEAPTPGWTSYETVYQDPKEWMKQGKHDFIVPMMYAKDNYYYPYVYNWQSVSNGRPIIPGLAVYQMERREKDWPLRDITDQIDFTRMTSTGGQGYYRAGNLLQNEKGIWDYLLDHAYTSPALLPLMNWNDSIIPLAPSDLQITDNKSEWIFTWNQESEEGKTFFSTYTLYGLPEANTSSLPAKQIIRTGIRENQIRIPKKLISPEINYFCVTACDESYNESAPSEPSSPYFSKQCSNQGIFFRHSSPKGEYTIETKEIYSHVVIKNNLNQTLFSHSNSDSLQLGFLPSGSYKVILIHEDGKIKNFVWNKL
ncbi:MAG: family 10 glycosylhydrolase [Bacteroidales bacterium]|nr:family 10 glycosylhydrolase [Bacteroidales bacterium]